MKKFLSAAKHMLPALAVIIVLLVCAAMPELGVIPDRLTSEVEAGETDEAEDTDSTEQAVGDYVDGTYVGSATGYGGLITVQVTVEDSQMTEIEVLDHSGETDSFYNRAVAVIDSILLAQTWEVDAISGATYSSNGIKNAVKNAITGEETESETAAESGDDDALEEVEYEDPDGYTDGIYYGSATGFGGTITVAVTIEDGVITSIEIVSAPGETESYFSQALAVIDAILSAQSPNVDAISGATYSSNGIINAVKEALSQAVSSSSAAASSSSAGSSSSSDDSSASGSTVSDTSALPNYGYIDGTYTGSGIGYGGEVVLSVTIEGGQIVDIEVVSAEGETYAYWNQAIALLDLIIEAQTTDGIDAVSGATFSSNGILDAVAEALAQAAPSDDEEDNDSTDSGDADDGSDSGSSEDGSTGSDDAEDETSSAPNYGYVDGTYTGTGIGYGGEIVLIVTIEGGLIVDIEVVSADGETYAYWMQAVTLIDLILETQTADGVDVVAGATYSSNGIISAIQDALEQAAPSDDEEDNDGTGSGSDDDADADTEDTDTEEEDSGIDFSELPNYGYTDGTYTGTGYGYGGDIVLTVTVEGGQIVSIEVVSADGETYAYWIQAVTLTDTIILAQTWEVDAVSGATFSSEGIMEAVQNALADAIAGDDDDSSEGNTDDSSSEDGSSDTETPDEDTEDDQSTDTGGDADNSTDDNNTSDDSTGDDSTTDDETLNGDETSDDDSSGEPVTTVTSGTYTVTGTATVYPDEYEDFDAYEITVAITLQKTVTSVTDGSTVTITTETEIIDAEYSSDTDSTNLRYLSRAWTKMTDSLLAGEEADAVSGATCSSTGIQTAWDEALSGVTLGIVTETTETDESDEEEEEDTEPVTTEEVYTVQYSYTVTITPDEDEDFDAYEAVITITVQTTVVTVKDGNSVTVTTTNEILDTAYESDTDSTNLRYLSRAWTKMADSLTAGEEVDAVSGATCSSNAILEAWEQFYSEVTLGTETTEYETASSYAVQSSAVIYANIPEPVDPEKECLTDSDDADGKSDDKEQDKKAGETARKEEDEE